MDDENILPDFGDSDLLEFLDAPNITNILYSQEETNLNKVNYGDIFDGFDSSISASDASLTDQNSPNGLPLSPGFYSYNNSPSSASIDSGVQNSVESLCPDSPQLSPESSGYVDYINNFGNVLPFDIETLTNAEQSSNTDQPQDLLLRLINHQVQQALVQQQQQQQQQQVPLMHMQLQQQLVRLVQQQQQILEEKALLTQNQVPSPDTVSTQSKSDSQLRKMLLQTKTNIAQTKNTIMNSIQDKKERISNFKFPKPGNHKPNKRKSNTVQNDSPKFEKKRTANENVLLSPLMSPLMDSPRNKTYDDVGLPTTAISVFPDNSQNDKTNSQPISTLNKIPISRLKSITPLPSSPPKPSKSVAKRTRVEHVVIEKRYRMKITDSLNELKIMLNCEDDKKATKNTILQAAIDEIKGLRKANESLTKKNTKMRKLFEELRSIGIIPSSQTVSSTSSESNGSDQMKERIDSVDVEPEINQDHYVSPLQRQSARDGAKLISCFTIFMFLFVNPLNLMFSKSHYSNGGLYTSRRLLSVGNEQESSSPHFYLFSNLINIIFSFLLLMVVLIRGNPRCPKLSKNSKLTVCFTNQLRKAQMMINKHEYEDAKVFLRIALFIIGNSCPKTPFGQFASFMWKCCSHILYQLGIVSAVDTVARIILPSSISLTDEKEDRELAAKLSSEAYRKLHEISLKDRSNSYLEAACYLMNTIYSAEVSGDHELLCTAYATAVVHMKEKVFYPCLLQYYFTGCAHHVSLASKDSYPFAIDWIFENRGYEYFANGSWNIKKNSQFYVHCGDSDLDEADLLQMVYQQFQEHLLSKALKRMVVPETYYPNEGRIELRQRASLFLDRVGKDPVNEHLDNMSIYHHALYGWWGATLNYILWVLKNDVENKEEMFRLNDLYENIDERHRHVAVEMMRAVTSSYIAVQVLKNDVDSGKILTFEFHHTLSSIHAELKQSSILIKKLREETSDLEDLEDSDETIDVNQLVLLLCCELMIDTRYALWQIGGFKVNDEELEFVLSDNQYLQHVSLKYVELAKKVRQHDHKTQAICGINLSQLENAAERTQHLVSVSSKTNDVDSHYYDN